jgi:LuxR family transcriptional activator of conjugal transfer of Ti plasmids
LSEAWGVAVKWDFDGLIDRIVMSKEGRAIRSSLRRFAANNGFEHFAYINFRASGVFAISNYPPEWQSRYLKNRYERVDPVIWMASQKRHPFVWAMGDQLAYRSEEHRLFVAESEAFGIRSGVSIPLPTGFGHRAIVTFASSDLVAGKNIDINPQEALVAASIIHAFIMVGEVPERNSVAPNLSPQESVCLKWIAEGKKTHEIADMLGVKSVTVRSALDEAKRKLNAVTLPQATALATALHLI